MLMSDTAHSTEKPSPEHNPDLAKLAKSYEPAPIEAFWGPEWESHGIATAKVEDGKDNFCIQ